MLENLHGGFGLLRHDQLLMSERLLIRVLHLSEGSSADIALGHRLLSAPVRIDLKMN